MSESLVAKLEQAKEGDHELNVAIGAMLGWQPPKRDDGVAQRWALWLAPDGKAKQLPWFSESLDAALTLVPEGWSWRIQNNGLTALCAPDNDLGDYSKGATPALSCCIASLKERACIGHREGQKSE